MPQTPQQLPLRLPSVRCPQRNIYPQIPPRPRPSLVRPQFLVDLRAIQRLLLRHQEVFSRFPRVFGSSHSPLRPPHPHLRQVGLFLMTGVRVDEMAITRSWLAGVERIEFL